MTNAPSVKTVLLLAVAQLKAQGFEAETAKFEAQLLLQHVLKVNSAWLIAHQNDALEANIHAMFEARLNRRLNSEPMAYILGYREFYGLKLKVTAYTLIPRPDTEALVEAALKKISTDKPTRILDLGTGSGAIALAIAKHRPKALVTATDASEKALKIAEENAENLNITNVNFVLSDWLTALNDQKFDVIVSNPPYIEADDPHLSHGDLRFEPLSALASGADGLDDIRRIIAEAPDHLHEGGWLMFEHGYQQAKQVAQLLNKAGFHEVETVQDLGGNNRVTFGRKR